MQTVSILTFFSLFLLLMKPSVNDKKPTFDKDIYPLIKEYCLKCHKPGGSKKAQGLLMNDPETALENILKNKPTDEKFSTFLVPGKSEESVLYLKLVDPPYGKKMPLGENKPTVEEIKLIKNWIDSGAKK